MNGGFDLCSILLISVADIRQQSAETGAFDSCGKLALMLCAGAGYTAWKDLGALADAFAETRDILIIDVLDLVNAELALLLAMTGKARTVRSTLLPLRSRFGGL